MSAERADNLKILEDIKKTDYKFYEMIKTVNKNCFKVGATGAAVITTEDMTTEEQEMALYEGFLKEGYPPDIASKKAKEWLHIDKALWK